VERTLTVEQAYFCMCLFLIEYNKRGRTDEMDILLGSLAMMTDGPADPAMKSDWEYAVQKVLNGDVDDAMFP
jgi:hypothetical protein